MMISIQKPTKPSSVVATAAMMLLVSGLCAAAFAQDQDTERRFWPPNYRPAAATNPAPAPARPAKYKRTTPALDKNTIPTAVEKDNIVGITIWRLRASEEADKLAQEKT